MRISRTLLCLLGISGSMLAAAAQAEYPDWASVADVEVIEILTRDTGGDVRETKVWFVLVDGEPHLCDCHRSHEDHSIAASARSRSGGSWRP